MYCTTGVDLSQIFQDDFILHNNSTPFFFAQVSLFNHRISKMNLLWVMALGCVWSLFAQKYLPYSSGIAREKKTGRFLFIIQYSIMIARGNLYHRTRTNIVVPWERKDSAFPLTCLTCSIFFSTNYKEIISYGVRYIIVQ